MDAAPSDSEAGPLAPLPAPLQWVLLLALSAALIAFFELIRLPAGFLIDPMIAGVAFGVNGAIIRLPKPLFSFSHAMIGCLVAASISVSTLAAIAQNLPAVASVVILTLMASSLLGWLISRWKIMPGTTAVWRSSPGAASAMVLMAGAFGADQRLVAFMQYLRVIMVTISAATIARLWIDPSAVTAHRIGWFETVDWGAFGVTLLLAGSGAALGRLLRLPAPYFLGVMIVAGIVHVGFGVRLELPPWILALCYAFVGWSVGLTLTPAILRHATRKLPQIALSILVLMAFCGVLGWLLVAALGVNPLTAYLATSPGGMDSVAIIAAASPDVDLSIVMSVQAARFLIVLLAGPWIARMVARSLSDKDSAA